MRVIAIVLGVLGGLIGLFSAISAFVAVGGDPAYCSRLWLAQHRSSWPSLPE